MTKITVPKLIKILVKVNKQFMPAIADRPQGYDNLQYYQLCRLLVAGKYNISKTIDKDGTYTTGGVKAEYCTLAEYQLTGEVFKQYVKEARPCRT